MLAEIAKGLLFTHGHLASFDLVRSLARPREPLVGRPASATVTRVTGGTRSGPRTNPPSSVAVCC